MYTLENFNLKYAAASAEVKNLIDSTVIQDCVMKIASTEGNLSKHGAIMRAVCGRILSIYDTDEQASAEMKEFSSTTDAIALMTEIMGCVYASPVSTPSTPRPTNTFEASVVPPIRTMATDMKAVEQGGETIHQSSQEHLLRNAPATDADTSRWQGQ